MYKGSIQETKFQIKCVGMQRNRTNTVFYLVVETDEIIDIRNYHPHITIGFVGGDVFVDESGNPVSKGEDTCVVDITYY